MKAPARRALPRGVVGSASRMMQAILGQLLPKASRVRVIWFHRVADGPGSTRNHLPRTRRRPACGVRVTDPDADSHPHARPHAPRPTATPTPFPIPTFVPLSQLPPLTPARRRVATRLPRRVVVLQRSFHLGEAGPLRPARRRLPHTRTFQRRRRPCPAYRARRRSGRIRPHRDLRDCRAGRRGAGGLRTRCAGHAHGGRGRRVLHAAGGGRRLRVRPHAPRHHRTTAAPGRTRGLRLRWRHLLLHAPAPRAERHTGAP